MINYEPIKIVKSEDYQKIMDKLPEPFKKNPYTQKWIDELKSRMNSKCSMLLIESPYYDSEYLSSYYQYYSKKFRDYGKKSCRIHFTDGEEYLGYIVVSPTMHYLNLSKSYLDPRLFLKEDAFLILSSFKINIGGEKHKVAAFPWMNQQKDFSMCAHVAAWEIMKFYGNEHSGYKDINMGNIIDNIPEQANRKLPSKGLNLQQMAEIFKVYGSTPLIIKKDKDGEQSFYQELLCYIESGIPVVAALDSKEHVIAVIGHGKIDSHILDKKHGLINSSECIDSIVVNDDNIFPYYIVGKDIIEAEQRYSIKDIDFIIVPLYNRVHQEYAVLYERVKSYLQTGNLIIAKDSVMRMYIASANSLKQKAREDKEMDEVLKDILIRLEMPKLVWCVEISSKSEYKERKVSSRMIIDSTASAGETTPWLLVHDSEKIRYFTDDKWYEIRQSVSVYNMYQHNLEEVAVWK